MTSDTASDEDPAERLGQLLEGYQATQAAHVAARLGILDILQDGPKTAQELASSVGAHEPSLRRFLRFLTTLGFLAQVGEGRLAATPLGDLLRADHPASERPWALLLGAPIIWRPWGALYEAVMSGRPAFEHAFGEPFFSYLGHEPEQAAIFNGAMSSDGANLTDVLDAYDFSGASAVVDVGGGHGALLRGILERAPRAKGILFDLPTVVAEAQAGQNDEQAALASRWEWVGGDMFTSVPAGGDLYVLKRIIHDWSDEESTQILRNCRQAMSDQGKLLLVEGIWEPASQSDPASAVDLMMLTLVTGRERTEEEFRAVLAAADLRLTRVIPAGRRSIIEAVVA